MQLALIYDASCGWRKLVATSAAKLSNGAIKSVPVQSEEALDLLERAPAFVPRGEFYLVGGGEVRRGIQGIVRAVAAKSPLGALRLAVTYVASRLLGRLPGGCSPRVTLAKSCCARAASEGRRAS